MVSAGSSGGAGLPSYVAGQQAPAGGNGFVSFATVWPVISIDKTSSTTTALTSGEVVTYKIVVTNTGTAAASNVTVSDTLPTADFASAQWTCADTAGGTICPTPGGNGLALNETISSLPANGTATYMIVATAITGTLPAIVANTATAAGSNLACANGTPPPCSAEVTNPFTEADMQAMGTPVNATVGTPVTVTTTCTNNGPNAAQNATCAIIGAPAGATTACARTPPVASLASGDSIACTITFTPTDTTPVTLTTTAGSDTPDPTPANNTGTVTIIPADSAPPVPVPLLDRLALAVLAMSMALVVARCPARTVIRPDRTRSRAPDR